MKTIALFVGLILYVQSVPHLNAAVLIATNATWKYLDNGTDQGTAWRSPAYDDSAWAAGPAELGYGELDEATVVGFGPDQNNKYITTYFRRTFNVSSPSNFASLTIRLERDDGAVVYLNGTELFRDSMPTGAVNYATLASSATEGNIYVTTNVSNALNSGQNVIAVEMHQQAVISADLSFSLELIGDEPQPLVMRILGFDAAGAHLAVEGPPGNSITIQSSVDGAVWSVLQSGTIGPSGVFFHTNSFGGGNRLYRALNDAGGGGGVYSVNVVGVYQLSIAPGYAMIANHLLDVTNTVAALLPSPPPGTSIYKIGSDNRFAVNNYLQGWSDAAMMLRPGDGVFIRNPTASAMTVAFKGELLQGTLVNQLPAGFTICSSIVPQSGPLQTALQFPAAEDDTIYVLTAGAGYNSYTYFSGEWIPQEPVISVGQAFWSLKGAPVNWSRNFSVSGGGGSYTATQFAAASSVAQVNFLTYNANTSKGRVFLAGGVNPVSSNFFGQLYAGTAASEASLAPIGAPAQFLGNAGYVRSGTVVVPSASPNDSRFFQVRAWDVTSGTNYEAAVGGARGKSAIFSAVVGGGLQIPPDVNDFASFAVISPPSPPAITTQPQSQTVVVGSNATFSVTASGADPLGYQWFFSGTAVGGATSATLALNNVQAANAGSYRVVVNNAFGSVTSIVATLTVTQRGLIAAESFVYPVGSIVGRNGGFGFRGAYTGGGSATSNSLAYTDTNGAALATTGGRYLAMPSPYQPALRDLDTNGQPGAKFGAPGSIIYVGFLVKLDSGTNAGVGWGGVSLLDGAIERVFFGDPGFEGQLNWGVDRQLGSNNVRLSSVPVDFSTHLLVGRIDFGVEDATVRLYVDPPLNREPSTASVLPFAAPPFRFTAVRIAASPNDFSFDEIKIGTSYDDVVQALPPWVTVGTILQTPGANFVAFEAETHVTLTAGTPTSWVITNDVTPSGNRALFAAGANNTPFPTSFASYAIKFNTPGAYKIFLRWRANEAFTAIDINAGNSYFAPLAFDAPITVANPNSAYAVSSGNSRIAPQSNIYGVGAENNLLTVSQGQVDAGTPLLFSAGTREAGIMIDRFVLTLDSALTEAQFSALPNSETMPAEPQQTPPAIAELSAVSGAVGSALFINGSNFSSIASNNIVYFGTVRAVVSSATSTQLVVTVPAGAAYAPVSVTVAGLTGSSRLPFGVTFASVEPIDSNLFAPPVGFQPVGGYLSGPLGIADMDGDGRNDVLLNTRSDPGSMFTLVLMTNRSSPGAFTSNALSSVYVIDTGSGDGRIADLDGDGRLDIVTWQLAAGPALQSAWEVYRNTSAPGAPSFAKSALLSTNDRYLVLVGVGDLDGDGRTDLLGKSTNSVYFALRNVSAPGAIAFGPPSAVFSSCNLDIGVELADLDGDGKLDVVLEGGSSCKPEIFRNTATPGNLGTNSFAPGFNLSHPGTRSDISIADFDYDGKLDIAMLSCPGNFVSVFRNVGSAGSLSSNSFAQGVDFAVGGWHQYLEVGDFDGDGRPDIVTAGCTVNDGQCGSLCGSNTVSVLQNISIQGALGSSSFAGSVVFPTLVTGAKPTAGDLDGDGRPDLVVANYTANFSVWRNIIPPMCVTPPTGLIAWYPMDGSANDLSGHGNNGIVHGAVPTANRFGVPNSAYSFNGADNFIEVPDTGSFNFTYPVSLVAWVNPLDASRGGIVGQWGYGGGPDAYLLSLSSNRVTGTLPRAGLFQTTSSGTLPLSNWTHIGMTFDGATVRYYINGAPSGTFASPPITNHNINEPVIIGLENIFFDNLNYFHGSLDDVLIFNRAVSSNEIAAIYFAGSAGMCPPQPLQLTVQGSGTIIANPQSTTYPFGSMVMISAVPDRYHTFLHWSDGNTNSQRTITVGPSNDYTAIFTNTVPLETRTVKLWDRSFGGTNDDYNPVMKSTSDGGVIVVAQTQSGISGNKTTGICSPGNWAAWVLKLDANGNKQWEQTIGMPSDFSVLYGVTQTSDGGYALGGYVGGTPVTATNNCGRTAPGFGGYDLWLVRLGTNGQRLWDASFGGSGNEGAFAIVPTADGGFLLAGDSDSASETNKTSPNYGGGDGWIVRVDLGGHKLWERSFGGANYDVFGAAALMPDGGFLLAGSSHSPPGGNKTSPAHGSNDFWAVRVDANGNKLWEQSYGGNNYDALLGLSLMEDGGAVLSGFSSSTGGGTRTSASFGPDDYWVVRIDANGNQVWDRAFGGNGDADWGYRTLPADDGGLTVCGFSNSGVNGNKTTALFGLSDGWAVRLDAYGNKIGEFAAGGPGGNSFTDLAAAVNGEIFFAGDTDSGPGGNKTSPHWGALDVWVVKAVARTAPVGTPIVLVDGRIDPSNTVLVTNSALLEIQSTFPGANIFFTLDGSDPDQGEIYTGPLVITSDAIVRAVAYTANFQTSAEADPVVILVAQAPVIIVNPQSQVVAAGVTVTFSVVASGEEPLRYQWFKSELELPGQTNATLFIFGAQTSDAGLYSVAVANAHGLVHSDAVLGIIEPPMITVQPMSVSVMLSNSVMFCVEATGGGPLRYQWRRNGGNIPNETNQCLEISPVTLGDGGTYEVIIANPVAAVVSQPAVLRLILPAAAAGDNFANRVSLDNFNRVNGIIQSTNVGATKEPGEPNHGGKPGGSSVWYRWTAPFAGIATFRTVGSSFDTLLAVYTGPNVSNLTVIASDEDSGGFLTSLVRFSTVANREYAIAVDGFGDTEGEFALSWELTPNANPLPVVLQQPQSQTVLPGTNVLLSVVASNAASFLWFRNGTPLYAETSPQLTIPVARPEDVGDYRVAITNSTREGIQSEIAILEIARGARPPGARSADKIEDLTFPVGPSGGNLRAGKTPEIVTPVRAGLTDLQILNNSGSSTSIGESNACGVIGDASRWFQVRAFSNATMRVDTVGSSIDTILSVYIGTNQLAAGFRLVPGGCDDDSGPNGTSIVRFPATNGVDYSIQIGGKTGTNGIVFLNFGLGFAPSNSQSASRQVARQGDNITLNCTAVGTPDPMFFWYRSNQTASAAFVAVTASGSLPLLNLQPDKQGTYTVIVSNFIASITNTIAEVVVQTNALIAAQTGFDSSMDGWTGITNGGALDLRHSGAGGNPGGHLAVRNIPIAGSWYWVAPAAYLGNKFYCYNGSLSFELRQTITDSLASLPAEDVILEGAGQRLVVNLSNPAAPIWTTYRVSLNESPSVGWRLGSLAGPTVTREQFLAVLTSLTNLMIRGAAGSGTELGQIDSVLLLGSTTPALSIRADGSDWLIEWPQALAGFSLQTVTAFQPAAATPQVDQWIGTTQPPTLTNGLNSVRVPGLPTQQFFRLRKPAQ